MEVLALVLLGPLWLLSAAFSAAQTVWAAGEHDIKDKMAIRFFHGLSIFLLLVSLFSISFPLWVQVSFCVTILLTVELLPIFFARRHLETFQTHLSSLVHVISRLCGPLTKSLDKADNALDMEDLSSALEVVSQQKKETQESKILKGIVQFGEIEASAIMTPRVKMVCVSTLAHFDELMSLIREAGYSRMPVYNGNLDHIAGLLYIKDLLPHLNENPKFEWQKLMRPALFIPETKKIDLLLKELQERRVHLALIVDEYGGTTGLITLEDILEEVVGEISDEFDAGGEDLLYRKMDPNHYLFDARMPIHDFCRLMNLKDDFFDEYDGEFETLAGFILESLGRFPIRGEQVSAPPFIFTVENLDSRKIKRIKMKIEDA